MSGLTKAQIQAQIDAALATVIPSEADNGVSITVAGSTLAAADVVNKTRYLAVPQSGSGPITIELPTPTEDPAVGFFFEVVHIAQQAILPEPACQVDVSAAVGAGAILYGDEFDGLAPADSIIGVDGYGGVLSVALSYVVTRFTYAGVLADIVPLPVWNIQRTGIQDSLAARVATLEPLPGFTASGSRYAKELTGAAVALVIDNVIIENGDIVLVKDEGSDDDGLYVMVGEGGGSPTNPWVLRRVGWPMAALARGYAVHIAAGIANVGRSFRAFGLINAGDGGGIDSGTSFNWAEDKPSGDVAVLTRVNDFGSNAVWPPASSLADQQIFSTADVSIVTPTANTTFLGLARQLSGSGDIQGPHKPRLIVNKSSLYTITLAHEDAGAVAADRIKCPNGQPIVLAENESATVLYDSAATRWVATKGGDLESHAGLVGPTAVSADTDNYNPTGFPLADVAVINPNAPGYLLSGFVAPTARQQHRKVLVNTSQSHIILTNEDTGSTDVNRIRTQEGRDLALRSFQSLTIQYDTSISRWRVAGDSVSVERMTEALASDQNNWIPDSNDDWQVTAELVITPSASGHVLTGLSASPVLQPLRRLLYNNDATDHFVLTHEDALSLAANRFNIEGGRDRTVEPGETVIVEYFNAKWRVQNPDVGSALVLANASGGALTQGTPVYLIGDETFAAADANQTAAIAAAVGIVASVSVSNTDKGRVQHAGAVTIPTARKPAETWAQGDRIYVSLVAGNLTNVAPSTSTEFVVPMGRALADSASGFDAEMLIEKGEITVVP
jgi:hypothetical protein